MYYASGIFEYPKVSATRRISNVLNSPSLKLSTLEASDSQRHISIQLSHDWPNREKESMTNESQIQNQNQTNDPATKHTLRTQP